jgi:hypothetical protein
VQGGARRGKERQGEIRRVKRGKERKSGAKPAEEKGVRRAEELLRKAKANLQCSVNAFVSVL